MKIIYSLLLLFTGFFAQAQSETESNNTFALANPIEHNLQVTGTISCSGDASDFFKAVLPRDGAIRIISEATNTSGASGYVGLYAYDKSQNQIGFRYIGGTTSVPAGTTVYDTLIITCRAADTTYFLINQGSQCFSYKLRYEIVGNNVIVSDTGRNENFTEANYIDAGHIVNGKIAYLRAGFTDGADFYKTLLPRDGVLRIISEATNTSAASGYVGLYAYDRGQNQIGFRYIGNTTSVPAGTTVYDTINITCRAADTTYFLINQGSQCFTYKLRYEMLGDDVIVSDTGRNETFAEANNININDTAKGKINYTKAGSSDENDYYKTLVPADGSVRVYIQGTNTGNSTGYAALYAYDKNQNQIGFTYIKNTAVAAGETVSDSITLYCRAADSLYFLVYRGNQCFTYKLNYALVGGNAPNLSDTGRNETLAEANVISVGENVAGKINNLRAGFTDQNDYYKSFVPLDGTVRVFLEATNTGNGTGYVSFYGYDKAGNQLANKYISGSTAVPVGITVYDTVDINCRLSDSMYFLIYGGSQCFNYKMRYEVIGTANEIDIEPNSTFAQAINITMRDTVKGNINNSRAGFTDASDYYKTKLVSDGLVRVYLEVTNTSTGNGYVSFYAYNKNQGQIFNKYIGNSTALPAKATIYDTIDLKCQPEDDLYFLIFGGSQCFNYKLSYEVTLGTDTTTMVCPGFTTDISKLYNVKPFSVVKYENMASPGPAIASTVVGVGTYRLSVYNGVDACSRDTAIITVANYPKPTPAYTINSNPQCLSGNSFTFTNTSTISAGTMTYQWTFGDNTSSTVASPTHSYSAAGVYNVKLIATSNNGCKDSIMKTVTVAPMPVSGFTINTTPQCLSGNNVVFTNTSTIASGTVTYQWSFGDNTSSTVANPTKVYTTAGTFNVKLIATSNNGCKDSLTKTVTINPQPTPGFTINNATQCLSGNSFVFTNTSTISSGTMTRQWSFGDNTTSTALSPSKTYTAAGTYSVKLVVISNNGCKDSVTQTVTVNVQPAPGFTINTTPQCLSLNSFVFTNTSAVSTGTLTYQWSFGDNTTSTSQNPSKTYTTAGTYNVKLVATSNNGCKDSITKAVVVNANPVLGADKSITIACVGGTANITTLYNTAGYTTVSYSSATPTAATAGTYDLIVTNAAGCKDTAVITVQPATGAIIAAAGANTKMANRECTDAQGWTHYYNDNGTAADFGDDILLLSIRKNGNNIGTAGSGGFQVKTATTTGAGSNTGVRVTNPLINNASGFWAFNRYWQVTPTAQPSSPVGIRFYYTTQDLNDVNGSNPGHTHQQLVFYKLVGGNPDPTTNLAGAQQIISIMNGAQASTTTWTYNQLNAGTYYAEFQVSQFSGGGGGVTGNNQPLPLSLLDFTARLQNQDAQLQWKTAQEVNTSHFNIQRSADGNNFKMVGKTTASGLSASSYSFTDRNVLSLGLSKVYYRLQMADKDGKLSYSPVTTVNLKSKNLFSISPNPAHNIVNVKGNNIMQVQVIDNAGRIVITEKVNNQNVHQLTISHLTKGLYMVKIQDKDGTTQTEKLIIQ